jgi:hypothetical protein
VIEAVTHGKFRIYAVSSVDQGISLLTGELAENLHARVERRLSDYAERAREFAPVTRKAWHGGRTER